MTKPEYRNAAKDIVRRTALTIDVDNDAEVSVPTDQIKHSGAWVQCWLWVPNKEKQHGEVTVSSGTV